MAESWLWPWPPTSPKRAALDTPGPPGEGGGAGGGNASHSGVGATARPPPVGHAGSRVESPLPQPRPLHSPPPPLRAWQPTGRHTAQWGEDAASRRRRRCPLEGHPSGHGGRGQHGWARAPCRPLSRARRTCRADHTPSAGEATHTHSDKPRTRHGPSPTEGTPRHHHPPLAPHTSPFFAAATVTSIAFLP